MKMYQKSKTLTPADYNIFLAEAQRLQPKRVVEFGPGYSTFAWIEAGVPEIVGLEHDQYWFDAQKARFADFPSVSIRAYRDVPPVAEYPDDIGEFQLALVDSPKGYEAARVVHPGLEDCSRCNTLLAALELAPVVLLHDAKRPLERNSLKRAEQAGHHVEYINSEGSYGVARVVRDGKKQGGSDISVLKKLRRASHGAGPRG